MARRRHASGQALLEAMVGSTFLILSVSGFCILGLGLTARALVAHAMEENLICRRSLNSTATCDRAFRKVVAEAPGELRVISLRASGSILVARFRWTILGFAKDFRVEENSPLSE